MCSHTAGVPGLRQFGVQELDIIPIVSTLSKYSVHLTNPEMIRFELEKAVSISKSGRPGPVWIDIPMDVQAARVNPDTLQAFHDECQPSMANAADIDFLVDAISSADRPVIIAGRGIRIAGAQKILQELATRFSLPVVTPYLGIDNLRHDLDIYIGKTGVKGDRPANFAMQNSDLILAIGTSLHVSVIGYEYEKFARVAKKIVIDIDPTSHQKKTIKIDRLIELDAKVALQEISTKLSGEDFKSRSVSWLERCVQWKRKYPVCLPEYENLTGEINVYSLWIIFRKPLRRVMSL
jgi:acetolactate synthase-1/2/3 large subunit